MPGVCYKWWGWNFIFLNLLKNERSMIHISCFYVSLYIWCISYD